MKANSKALREVVYNKIIDEISGGKIVPGEKLNERQLAKRYNVSRTPVREALFQLEKVGVADFDQVKGIIVRKVTVKQFEEILDVISVLEGYAVETIVAHGLTSKELTNIMQFGEKLETNAKNKDYFKFAENNRIFHEYLVKTTKNSILQTILKELNSRIYTGGLSVPFYIDQYEKKHKEIIDAISKGLSKRAGIAMKRHNQDIKKFLVETLKNLKGTRNISF
jgi:DNA-binding GntR family transcriptional regulator